ncbi:MAG TPA: hypothetical protein VFB62_26010 [Polyangiaceae bacterium]|jgi:hypothetical protein|nr:hypothetical protein [Polyangiaceae bacterium]
MKELDRQLAKLPRHDVSALCASEMRTRAQREFGRAHRTSMSNLRLAYRRYLEPAWVAAVGAAYLGWAFSQVFALYG